MTFEKFVVPFLVVNNLSCLKQKAIFEASSEFSELANGEWTAFPGSVMTY